MVSSMSEYVNTPPPPHLIDIFLEMKGLWIKHKTTAIVCPLLGNLEHQALPPNRYVHTTQSLQEFLESTDLQ